MARLLFALALCAAVAAAAQTPAEEDLVEEREESEADPEEAAEPEVVKPPAVAMLPDRSLMARVGGSLSYDSNLFRSPDARPERYATAYAGLVLDKAYAQQRIRLDLTGIAYRYDHFSYLDFDALNYLGAWDWQLGPRIGGRVSATREQGLADYSEFRNPGELNVRTTESFLANADAWLSGGWHLVGGWSQLQNRYSVPIPQEGSYRASGFEAGVKWVAPSANWIGFNLRSLDGRYVDRPLDPVAQYDDGFVRREAEALAALRLTGKSTLEGRVAHVDYRSNNFSDRDFTGTAARLAFLWQATAKLGTDATFVRTVEPWADSSASYRVDQRATLGATWQAAARATLRLEARLGESEFRGPLPGFTGTPRHDDEGSVRLNAEWRALRNLLLNAGAQRYRQSSTDPAANFRGSLVTAGASLLF